MPSVGVPAGASLRERKSLGDFPNPPISLSKGGGKPEKRLAGRQVFFLVCPPGLEPGPGASEALMVSNSTTGTNFRLCTTLFCYSFCRPKPFFIFLYLFYSFLLSFCKRLWYNIFKFLKFFFFRPFFGAFCPFFRRFSPRFPFFQRGAPSKILFREYLLCKKR